MLGVGARTLLRRSLSSCSRDTTSRCVGGMLHPRPVLPSPPTPRAPFTSTACPRLPWPSRAPVPGQQCMAFHRGPVVRGTVPQPSKPPMLHTCRSLSTRSVALPSTRRPLSALVLDTTKRAAVTTWVLSGPVGWSTRGYGSTANQWGKRPRTAIGGSMGIGLGAGTPPTGREVAAIPPQTRGFWRLSNLKNSGVPMFFQVFYGTLLMIGMGVLLFTVMSLSAGAAVLFLLAYLGFRVAQRRPGGMVNALQHPMMERTQMGRMFRPLVELMAESSLFEGLRDIRSNIEEDVLHAINNHKELSSRYGDDFIAVGHHKMSMQSINGDKMVMLAFPVISTKPRELIVEVIAKQPRVVQDDVPDKLRWQYESVTIRPNDSPPVDITQTVAKGAGKHIIIEATAKRKSATRETKL